MKKTVILGSIIILLLIALFSNETYALEGTLEGVIKGGDAFVNKGRNLDEIINRREQRTFSLQLNNLAIALGIVVLVVTGTVIGIQFIIGGTEERAEIKEKLIPYIVGAFVLFSAFTIWKVVGQLAQSM